MSTEYLNRFIATAWPDASDLLGNEIINSAWLQAKEKGFNLILSGTEGTKINLYDKPKFTLSDSTLKFRLPGTNSYEFHANVDNAPDFDVINTSPKAIGSLEFPHGLMGIHTFRVRALDRTGRTSAWSDPELFGFNP